MVLEYYGIKAEEKTLRISSKTRFYGTHPIHIVECAKSYGLDAYASSLTLNKLQELVDQNVPVIANILKFNGDDFYVHSVVVYRLEQNIICFLDPEDGEKNLDITLFKQLWQRNDYFSIVIKKVE
jgi:ABC-type bacteriocin/lantibiotic exporter with double-glycine peptidase domain